MTIRRGFALLEVILVVGLIGAVAGVGVPLYRDYQIRNDLNLATEQVVQGLSRARLLSQAGQDDSAWGFYVPSGTLYKGDSYEARDPDYDEVYPMPSTITPRGLFEVNYGKVSGRPNDTGEIQLLTLNDYERNILIEVKTESIAVVAADKFTICHNPSGSNPQTLSIPDNAWPAHQAHGDIFGTCPTASSAAAVSSSTSSSSSSIVSSSSTSSSSSKSSAVSSEALPASCPDRLAIDTDGTIHVLGDLSVQFDSLGAQFGYGNGGPIVPVYVDYRKKNSGSWKELFDGDMINGTGGDSDTISFKKNNEIYVRFHALYKQNGWLTYENYAYSVDDDYGVISLRDGDLAPTIPAGNGQQGISTLLQAITDNTGHIDIGEFDVVMIADFNRESCNSCSNFYCSNCSGVDYQDGVVLLRFLTPAC